MQIAPILLSFIVLWVASLLLHLHMSVLGRMAKRQQQPLRKEGLPPVSIVVTTHNQASELQGNLPLLLEQAYPQDYEVVVVDCHSDDETTDLLEAMEEHYPHLHHTFCPATACDISLERLALTLGFKSACHEWVCIMSADAQVPDNEWLTVLMQPITGAAERDVDAILGFTRYDFTRGWTGCRWTFFKLWQQMLWQPFAQHHAPYRADDVNLCYRKSLFMRHQGFASHANLMSGAVTLLVNHNIRSGRCRVNVRKEAIVCLPQPSDRMWSQKRLFYMETRRHMHHTFLYRLWYFVNVACNILFPLLSIGLITYFMPNYFTVIPLALMWMLVVAVKVLSYGFTARQMGVPTCHLLLPWLMLLIPLWDTEAWLRRCFTRKQTFRKRFL